MPRRSAARATNIATPGPGGSRSSSTANGSQIQGQSLAATTNRARNATTQLVTPLRRSSRIQARRTAAALLAQDATGVTQRQQRSPSPQVQEESGYGSSGSSSSTPSPGNQDRQRSRSSSSSTISLSLSNLSDLFLLEEMYEFEQLIVDLATQNELLLFGPQNGDAGQIPFVYNDAQENSSETDCEDDSNSSTSTMSLPFNTAWDNFRVMINPRLSIGISIALMLFVGLPTIFNFFSNF